MDSVQSSSFVSSAPTISGERKNVHSIITVFLIVAVPAYRRCCGKLVLVHCRLLSVHFSVHFSIYSKNAPYSDTPGDMPEGRLPAAAKILFPCAAGGAPERQLR